MISFENKEIKKQTLILTQIKEGVLEFCSFHVRSFSEMTDVFIYRTEGTNGFEIKLINEKDLLY